MQYNRQADKFDRLLVTVSRQICLAVHTKGGTGYVPKLYLYWINTHALH